MLVFVHIRKTIVQLAVSAQEGPGIGRMQLTGETVWCSLLSVCLPFIFIC